MSKVSSEIVVAHVIYRFGIGGLENGLVNLINRLDHEKYRHHIICLSDYDPEFAKRLRTKNTELVGLGKRPGHDITTMLRLFRLLWRLKPDVLHTRNFGALEYQLFGFLLRIRNRLHGEHGWDVGDLDGTRKSYQRARRLIGLGLHRFVTVSQHLETYLTDVVGVRPDKVRQIYNGVDTEKFSPPTQNELSGPLVIGTVGRMQTVKNQTLLARAFVALVTRRADLQSRIRLRFIGDGPLLEACREILSAGNLLSLGDFVGASDEIADELRNIDIFVLPSLAEGISNTILEAMATGLPVIATNVGGSSELVVDGRTGALVASEDTAALAKMLERYIDQTETRLEHGRAARARIEEQFSLKKMVAAYDELYCAKQPRAEVHA